MVEEGLQGLPQVHDLGHIVLVEHVQVQREADLEIRHLEELLHQELGRHLAGARVEHDAHVLGRLIAHVFEDRQLLGGDDLGDALDQLALLDLIGDLGDDDAVLSARQLLLVPARAEPERTAASLVRLDDRGARLDQQAAGREVRPLYQIDQRVKAILYKRETGRYLAPDSQALNEVKPTPLFNKVWRERFPELERDAALGKIGKENFSKYFDATTAKKLHDHVYAAGGARDPTDLYVAFRGRLPDAEGLIRRRGLSILARVSDEARKTASPGLGGMRGLTKSPSVLLK